ncbi:MAG: type II toxin-antitoxin system PemK/MazF family toxin [Alphaproteobacteria bacterium]|nr:type II toxin-antitoxin system PemK/MazF family toxin [Alphaproteobacteria bacterium]
MTQKLKFGEIWLANLNPPSGTEPGKTRPVLIIQSQSLLDVNHPSTLIIPLTTNLIEGAEPLRMRVKAMGKLEKDSDLLIDQLRAIDNARLIKGPLAQCDLSFMVVVQKAILDVIDWRIVDIS